MKSMVEFLIILIVLPLLTQKTTLANTLARRSNTLNGPYDSVDANNGGILRRNSDGGEATRRIVLEDIPLKKSASQKLLKRRPSFDRINLHDIRDAQQASNNANHGSSPSNNKSPKAEDLQYTPYVPPMPGEDKPSYLTLGKPEFAFKNINELNNDHKNTVNPKFLNQLIPEYSLDHNYCNKEEENPVLDFIIGSNIIQLKVSYNNKGNTPKINITLRELNKNAPTLACYQRLATYKPLERKVTILEVYEYAKQLSDSFPLPESDLKKELTQNLFDYYAGRKPLEEYQKQLKEYVEKDVKNAKYVNRAILIFRIIAYKMEDPIIPDIYRFYSSTIKLDFGDLSRPIFHFYNNGGKLIQLAKILLCETRDKDNLLRPYEAFLLIESNTNKDEFYAFNATPVRTKIFNENLTTLSAEYLENNDINQRYPKERCRIIDPKSLKKISLQKLLWRLFDIQYTNAVFTDLYIIVDKAVLISKRTKNFDELTKAVDTVFSYPLWTNKTLFVERLFSSFATFEPIFYNHQLYRVKSMNPEKLEQRIKEKGKKRKN